MCLEHGLLIAVLGCVTVHSLGLASVPLYRVNLPEAAVNTYMIQHHQLVISLWQEKQVCTAHNSPLPLLLSA